MDKNDASELSHEQAEFLYVLAREFNISTACTIVGIDRATVLEWQNINPVFRRKMEECKEKLLDGAEKTMFQLAAKGDFKAAKYILDSHGRERGWGENTSDGLEAFIAPMISATEAKLLGFINSQGGLVKKEQTPTQLPQQNKENMNEGAEGEDNGN